MVSTIKVHKDPVVSVHKSYVDLCDAARGIVYFILGSKQVKYPEGRSRILYIGTTQNPEDRPFVSLGKHSYDLLGEHGIRTLQVVYIAARLRKRVKISRKLERACLCEFRREYGRVPLANTRGEHMKITDEYDYFRRSRVVDILSELSQLP